MPKDKLKWRGRISKLAKAIVSLAALFSLAGCAGGETGGASTATAKREAPDACGVVSAAEVEQMLGTPAQMQRGDHLQSIAVTSTCEYAAADAHNLIAVLIRMNEPGLNAQATLQQYLTGIRNNMGDAYPIDTVDGLSAPAVWNPGMKQLTAFTGGALILVTVSDAGAKDPLEVGKALMERALPDLH